ncbi:MAG: class I adenylate-forming enzyme family protein [Alphaproteobacteria bacterium]|nr:class I adenylate-forming enzyme family protein [Alphaproteobacteria bacterium]
MFNTAHLLDAAARRCPNETAIVHDERRYSYAAVADLVNRAANGLRGAGFGSGDVIALVAPNRPGFVVAYYAILKIGAVAAVLSTGLKRRDLSAELSDCRARAVLAFDGFGDTQFITMAGEVCAALDHVQRLWVIPSDPLAPSPLSEVSALSDLMADQPARCATESPAGDATAELIFTSGSTGRNKGVEITHANLAAMTQINLAITSRAQTRVRLTVSPLFHIMGQTFGLNLAVLCGETMVLVDSFDPELVVRRIVEHQATHLVAMPIYYRKLMDLPDGALDPRFAESLKICGTGGGPLPGAWADEFFARFGLSLTPGYGLTEAGGIVSWHRPADPIKTETVGRPVPGVDVRVKADDGRLVAPDALDPAEGEIVLRSPGLMKGYLDRPEATAAAFHAGWLKTGDIGAFDDDGYLHIRGRISGRIIRGHEHIYPAEIETALAGHPKVQAAAAIAVPHEVLGQDIKTIVVLKDGAEIAVPELQSWLEAELPEGKAPGVIEFRDALPHTEYGKITYDRLR